MLENVPDNDKRPKLNGLVLTQSDKLNQPSMSLQASLGRKEPAAGPRHNLRERHLSRRYDLVEQCQDRSVTPDVVDVNECGGAVMRAQNFVPKQMCCVVARSTIWTLSGLDNGSSGYLDLVEASSTGLEASRTMPTVISPSFFISAMWFS